MTEKIVLITGASSGIGAEMARRFASLRDRVLLLARNEERLKQIAEEINAQGGQADTFLLDIGDYKAVIEVTNKIKAEIGIPDIIINNEFLRLDDKRRIDM